MAETGVGRLSGFSVLVAAVAVVALATAGLVLADRGQTGQPGGPTVVFASTDVNCKGGGTFSIGTGTDGGNCLVSTDASGNVTGGSCTDGGNKSSVTCGRNGGEGACDGTSGKGGCQTK